MTVIIPTHTYTFSIKRVPRAFPMIMDALYATPYIPSVRQHLSPGSLLVRFAGANPCAGHRAQGGQWWGCPPQWDRWDYHGITQPGYD